MIGRLSSRPRTWITLMGVLGALGLHASSASATTTLRVAIGTLSTEAAGDAALEGPLRSALAQALDARLRAESAMYGSQRDGGVTIGPPSVRLLPPGTIDAYVLETRAFGQGKVVHVHTTPTLGESIVAFAAVREHSP